MQVIELQCPHCSTRLRMRDLGYIGRVIHCPDCTEPVQIQRNSVGVVEAVAANVRRSASDATPRPPTRFTAAAPQDAPPPRSWRRLRRASTPRLAVWIAAVGVIALPLWYGLRQDSSPSRIATAPEMESAVDPLTEPPREAAPRPAVDPPTAASRMQSLADWVLAYRDRNGQYPAENPLAGALAAEQRLGWIATVAAERDARGPQPLWDEPLTAPVNSRFVRRQHEILINPLIAPKAADGLPSTHFVGIAGVGTDAPQLPADHRRAGVFAANRATTIAQIRDGLANTMMISGSAGRIVPWASGGTATMRPLTREPYINGPDGLGSGEADGMSAAMADGSVRFLSRETSGVILRRLAAMADGLPLDPAVPGDPGDSPPASRLAAASPATPPVEVPPEASAVDDRPIEARLAPDRVTPPPPPEYDVERALAQAIIRFEQVRPVPFRELLRQLEELAGVPVRLDIPQPEEILSREVSLQLSETTVGEILKSLVEKVDLTFETGRDFGVRVFAPGT